MIIWAGTSNKDVGMVIEHYPKVIVPRRKVTVQTIPGGNDIVIDEGAFENYEQEYNVFLDSKRLGGLQTVIPKLSNWLLGNPGYHRLEDSYFPDVYRMAYYTGGAEFVSVFNEYGEGVLTFNCAPEKYYKMGERPITLLPNAAPSDEGTGYLINPSVFPAKPTLMITGHGPITISIDDHKFGEDTTTPVNERTLTISEIGGSLTIDIRTHRIYSGDQNKASVLTGDLDKFVLNKYTRYWMSDNTNDNITVTIIPRWWTI